LIDYRTAAEMVNTISIIRENLERLVLGSGIPCVEKNAERMAACLKMLELNVNEAFDVLTENRGGGPSDYSGTVHGGV